MLCSYCVPLTGLAIPAELPLACCVPLALALTDTRVPLLPTRQVVFVLGGPGSGKGTQCALLVKEFGITHLRCAPRTAR